jgi:hypothetical protein
VYDPAVPFLGINPKELKVRNLKGHLHIHVESSITCNRHKMETTQVTTDKIMEQQNVIYMYIICKYKHIYTKEILLSLEKQENFDICHNTNEP